MAVLISYSQQDTDAVTAIVRGIEQAGYHTWYSGRDIQPGLSRTSQIGEAITRCNASVLLVSHHSVNSQQFSKEVAYASEKRKPVFPVLLDISPAQLQALQPSWLHAISDALLLTTSAAGIEDASALVIERLKTHGIHPEMEGAGPPIPKAVTASPGKPLPRSLADKILASRAGMEGERKQVTVLFADVAGFTPRPENADPEDAHNLTSQALAFITEEVHRYEGTIAQFLGDGVMALFGAPIAHEDAPQRALHAAMGIRRHLSDYARSLRRQGIEFNMRIGLNTGLVVVGRIGDDLTMEYTAMGDTVNLASRMQSTAQPGTIRVSENTYKLTEGYFEFKPLGRFRLKGRSEPVKAYQLTGFGRAKTRFGVSVVRGLTPFVGRQKELNHLMDSFELAAKGQGQLVGIVGEAGVGKSRLLHQMCGMLAAEEHLYLEGECLHYGEAIAYLPILGLLRSYFGVDEGDEQSVARRKITERITQLDERLVSTLPSLCELLSLKVEDQQYATLRPQKRREKAFEAIRSILFRESRNRPLVIAIEDLQWIDSTSQEFLAQLIGGLPLAPIMLVLLYRPEYRNAWTGKTFYSQIRVDEMTLETGAELLRAMLKDGSLAPALSEMILSRGAGNPLFIEEFTRALLEKGHIKKVDGCYALAVKPAEIVVPATVQGMIGARIDSLAGYPKRVLQVSSVIGREFSAAVLQMTLGLSTGLEEALSELQRLELIYEKNLFPETEYVFKHALTQDVAYHSLLLRTRREIHQKVGQAIEQLHPQRQDEFCETLAYHYSRSNSFEKAYHYLRLSGDKGARNFANLEAFHSYKEAISLLQRLPDAEKTREREIEVRVSAEGMMRILGYPEDSLEMLQEGERLSRELGRQRELAIFCSSIGLYYAFMGEPARGRRYAEEALEQSLRIEDVSLAGPIAFDLLSAYAIGGEYFKSTELAPRVLALMDKQGNVPQSLSGIQGFDLRSAILAYYGHSLAHTGDFEKAESLCQQALRIAAQIHGLYGLAFAEYMYGSIFLTRGSADEAMKHLENAVRYSDEARLPPLLSQAWLLLGEAHYLLEDLHAALKAAQEGLEVQRAAGYSMNLALHHQVLSLVHLGLGNLMEAERHASASLQAAKDSSEEYTAALAKIKAGIVSVKLDSARFPEAEKSMREGIAQIEQLRIKPECAKGYFELAVLYADAGQRQQALACIAKAQGMFREMGMDYWLARAETTLEGLGAS